jgi:hypothetical protein
MDSLDIADFLDGQQTGVLALGKDDDGYGVPLSYAFDETDSTFYFRLGFGPDSRKRAYVESADRVTFVVHADTGAGWHSVVAEGHLDQLAGDSLSSNIEEAVRDLDIPYFEVHDRPASEMELTVYRLDVERLTGLVEG